MTTKQAQQVSLPHTCIIVKMPPLPDDVLLIIFGHMDIDTFLDVRRLNHHVHGLVQSHIHGLTESVARSTFPGQTKILENVPDNEAASPADCLYWLKNLRYQQLAAILVEFRTGWEHAADDPRGDSLRRALAKAWRILADCAKIAKEVAATEESLLRARPTPASIDEWSDVSTAKYTPLRELELCRRYLMYFETLDFEQFRGYGILMIQLVWCVFNFVVRRTTLYQPVQMHQSDDRRSELWVSSYMLKLGPEAFWRSWWVSKSGSIEEKQSAKAAVEAAWAERDEVTREAESHIIKVISFQIEYITKETRKELRASSHADGNNSMFIDRILSGATSQDLRHQKKEAVDDDRVLPPRIFSEVPLKQVLSDAVTGWTVFPTRLAMCSLGGTRRREADTENHERRKKIQDVNSQYKAVYEEWERDWDVRQGWERQVAVAEKILAQALTSEHNGPA
ncbi:hypothetical protein LTR97_012715 [Elasticomyces elasticus]|uniref:F-box domain-containing protein n=1 Tax=Elasticomyces elasticus TaxID=574655 RepID=A0AAN7VY04_9PEZI|nr:hypothetical protein LTR97_012715 [Elasticomyces elasticus]